jgi:hypothetical protein
MIRVLMKQWGESTLRVDSFRGEVRDRSVRQKENSVVRDVRVYIDSPKISVTVH